MHDINGKALHVGDEIASPAWDGLAKIVGAFEEHNPDQGGSGLIIFRPGDKESMNIRSHNSQVVKVPTWKDMAGAALAVQDASNLSGVVTSFAQVIRQVRARLESEKKGGTDNVNQHPICQLYADKVAHLTGTQTFGHDEVAKAYTWAYTTMKGG